jgi:hypothetical protein
MAAGDGQNRRGTRRRYGERSGLRWRAVRPGEPCAPCLRLANHEAGKQTSGDMRFDADVLDYFKSRGRGWRSRMNAVLRSYVEKEHLPAAHKPRVRARG